MGVYARTTADKKCSITIFSIPNENFAPAKTLSAATRTRSYARKAERAYFALHKYFKSTPMRSREQWGFSTGVPPKFENPVGKKNPFNERDYMNSR